MHSELDWLSSAQSHTASRKNWSAGRRQKFNSQTRLGGKSQQSGGGTGVRGRTDGREFIRQPFDTDADIGTSSPAAISCNFRVITRQPEVARKSCEAPRPRYVVYIIYRLTSKSKPSRFTNNSYLVV